MTEFLTQVPPTQLGVMMVLVIILYKALDLVKALAMSKLFPEQVRNRSGELACQQDPLHFQRIQEIHDYTKLVAKQIDHGDFACQWKDREEVRDYLDVAKSQVTAMQSVVNELRLLRQELVITRNGNGGKGQ